MKNFKDNLKNIVKKATENVWYGRRSMNPVDEQTEIITNDIFEYLNENFIIIDKHQSQFDAQECLNALKNWNDLELKDGMDGHKLGNMRPMILTRKFLNQFLK